MRIVHILNSPNWSGASNYCLQLAREQHAQGHDILLLTEPGIPHDRARAWGIPLDASIRLNHRNPYLYVHAIRRLKILTRRFRPQIISCHINEGAWMAGMVARFTCPEARIVRTRTDIDPPKGHFINRYVHHHWTDHLIVGSLQHKRICHHLLDLPENKIDVVYGPVDTALYHPHSGSPAELPFRREIQAQDKEVLIGLVARFDPVKGHEFALSAFRRLLAGGLPARLVLLGYENQRSVAWLRERIEAEELNGKVDIFEYRDDLPLVIRALDVGLVSSIGSEANSRATLEFMASGKPVVATAVGVIPEIIGHEEHGFIVPPRDPERMALALARLVSNPMLRSKMGKEARLRTETMFNLQLFARQTIRVYEKVINAPSPPATLFRGPPNPSFEGRPGDGKNPVKSEFELG